MVAASVATVISPAAGRHFSHGATSAYSLTPAAWRELLARAGRLDPETAAARDR